MHWYKFNIADYKKDTDHLTMLEHGAYLKLLNKYYLNEEPLPLEETQLFRLIGVRGDDEATAIRSVLQDFFTKSEMGFIHKRCDVVIEEYKEKSYKASQSAKAKWDKINNANAMRTQCDGNANSVTQELKNSSIGASLRFEEFWSVWPRGERKMAKAALKKKWEKEGLDEIADKIISHVEKMKLTDQWTRGFEPMPATYINQKRYLDADDVDTQAGVPLNMLRKAI